jgi:BASS family bile acid:Na+ symporter
MFARITNAFAIWLLLGVAWAWVVPGHFTWFLPHIPMGLGLIMLGMGLTLRFEDFAGALKEPVNVLIGVVAQFLIMPLLGWAIAKGMGLPGPLAVGLILVASCPGGTASNVITHLAGGNVPLSVLMTTCSTLVAVVMTPLLTSWLAGGYVPAPGGAMLLDMMMVVVLPVVVGLGLNQLMPKAVGRLAGAMPVMSVLFIVLIVGAIVADKKVAIAESAGSLLLSVFLLHAGGFGLGWLAARVLGRTDSVARTISIEVGMQNSGLGAKLATTHFSDPLTAVPSAISAVFHSLIGSVLAAWWRRRG